VWLTPAENYFRNVNKSAMTRRGKVSKNQRTLKLHLSLAYGSQGNGPPKGMPFSNVDTGNKQKSKKIPTNSKLVSFGSGSGPAVSFRSGFESGLGLVSQA
jgi:hypothetical protein